MSLGAHKIKHVKKELGVTWFHLKQISMIPWKIYDECLLQKV